MRRPRSTSLFIVAAPIAILVGVWRYRPDQSRHWLLFAGGLALWCVGETYWNYYVWFLGKQAPYPSFADVAFLAAYPLLIAGVFVLARGGADPASGTCWTPPSSRSAAGVVSTLFLLEPLLSTSDSTFLKVIAVGFPVMDFVLLVALTQLLFRGRVTNFALRAFMVGTGALLVADAAYSYLSLKGAYTSGMIVDAGWLACYGLWGIAALHPSMAQIGSLARARALSACRSGASEHSWLALLVAPIVLIAQIAVSGQTRRRRASRQSSSPRCCWSARASGSFSATARRRKPRSLRPTSGLVSRNASRASARGTSTS